MQEGDTLVFVEVRYRKSTRFGSPLDTVNNAKQHKISIATQHYLQKNNIGETRPVRFDVIGMTPEITDWIKGAF
ncbi:MAG: putative endonuclease [Lentisphaeria bacterium]|jgi:putative endonuclease